MSAQSRRASIEVTGGCSWTDPKSRSVPLEASIVFWWMDGWPIRRSEGRTRDISEDGSFVFANAWPREMQVRFRVFLPVLRESHARQGWRRKGRYCVLNRPGVQGMRRLAILTQHTVLRVKNEIYAQAECDSNEPQLS
jgi:hypothetical protein